jgi:hypothetical protein
MKIAMAGMLPAGRKQARRHDHVGGEEERGRRILVQRMKKEERQ